MLFLAPFFFFFLVRELPCFFTDVKLKRLNSSALWNGIITKMKTPNGWHHIIMLSLVISRGWHKGQQTQACKEPSLAGGRVQKAGLTCKKEPPAVILLAMNQEAVRGVCS